MSFAAICALHLLVILQLASGSQVILPTPSAFCWLFASLLAMVPTLTVETSGGLVNIRSGPETFVVYIHHWRRIDVVC